jgi:hypothetical protein
VFHLSSPTAHRPAKLPATIYGGQEREKRSAAAFDDVIGFMKRIAGANNKRKNQHNTTSSNDAQGGRMRCTRR